MGRRAMWACRSAARDGAAGGARSGAPTLPRLWLVQEHTGVPQSARDLLSGGFNRHDGPSFLNPFRALSRALWRAAVHREAESGGGATSRGARGQLGLSSSAKISILTSRKSWCILKALHSYLDGEPRGLVGGSLEVLNEVSASGRKRGTSAHSL